MKDNTTKECIGTVAAIKNKKIYNHTNTMRTANDTPRIPVDAAQKTVDYRPEVFLHHAKQCIF